MKSNETNSNEAKFNEAKSNEAKSKELKSRKCLLSDKHLSTTRLHQGMVANTAVFK